MRRAGLLSLLSVLLTAGPGCSKPPQQIAEDRAAAEAEAERAAPEWKPKRRKPEVVRTDLVATDLPEPPTLDELELERGAAGEFDYPEGTDELAPRAAVELDGGLALVGQAYYRRRPGRPPLTWRWIGFVAKAGAPSNTKLGPGAYRAAIPTASGGAMLVGSRDTADDSRGTFAVLDGRGRVSLERDLDSPSMTELFALVPGDASDGELAVVGGYVDAQGWLVSLGDGGERRWHKFLSTHGYTQIRGLARLSPETGALLAIGVRAQGFGDSWAAVVPGDGGPDPSPAGAAQTKIDIAGADPHQMLEAIVDLGDAGLLALGTARKNHIQAHAQLIAVGFDRAGTLTWSRVVPDIRATKIYAGEATPTDPPHARFILEVPLDGEASTTALAQLDLAPGTTAKPTTHQLARTTGRQAAPMPGGLIIYGQTETGLAWQSASLD